VALQRGGLADPVREASSRVLFALWCHPEWDQFAQCILKPDASEQVGRQATNLLSFLQSELRRGYGRLEATQLVLPIVPTSTANAEQPAPVRKFDTAIITALPIELAAVQLLVGNKDGPYRDEMAEKHDLRAMEMEAAGALEALWNFGRSAMVVRGVCDYGVGKNDIWHAYAALAAAAVTVCLIRLL
jgi:hypothetical protein